MMNTEAIDGILSQINSLAQEIESRQIQKLSKYKEAITELFSEFLKFYNLNGIFIQITPTSDFEGAESEEGRYIQVLPSNISLRIDKTLYTEDMYKGEDVIKDGSDYVNLLIKVLTRDINRKTNESWEDIYPNTYTDSDGKEYYVISGTYSIPIAPLKGYLKYYGHGDWSAMGESSNPEPKPKDTEE